MNLFFIITAPILIALNGYFAWNNRDHLGRFGLSMFTIGWISLWLFTLLVKL